MTKWGTNATYEVGQMRGEQVLLLKGDVVEVEGCPFRIVRYNFPECLELVVDIHHEVEAAGRVAVAAPQQFDEVLAMVTIWSCQGEKFLLFLPDGVPNDMFDVFGETVQRVIGSSVHAYSLVAAAWLSHKNNPSDKREVLIALGATRDGQRASLSHWMNRRGRAVDLVDTGWALHEGPAPHDRIFDGFHVNTCRWRRRDSATIEVIDDAGLLKAAGREDETTDEAAERLEADPQPQMAIPTQGLDSDVVS